MQEQMIPGNPIANMAYQLAVFRLTKHIIRLMAATSGMPEDIVGEQVAHMVGVEYQRVKDIPADPALENKVAQLQLIAKNGGSQQVLSNQTA